MSDYAELKSALDKGRVFILDGAVGTQLQSMGVLLNNTAWAAVALKDYPSTTQRMHELYIKAGADIITTNTFPSARFNLEPLGLGEMTTELNLRAVMLAQAARDRASKGRKVWIAGSVSAMGIMIGREQGEMRYKYNHPRAVVTAEYAQYCLNEQAQILAEAGVDFFLTEAINENPHRQWVTAACLRTRLPTWVGFGVRLAEGKVMLGMNLKKSFEEALAESLTDGIAGVSIFHSSVDAIDPALETLRRQWQGPVAVYPEAERTDYALPTRDKSQKNSIDEAEFVRRARSWVKEGVQVIGGCCGIELSYIQRLAGELPRAVA
jgi:homocysteine S-methyltransferase